MNVNNYISADSVALGTNGTESNPVELTIANWIYGSVWVVIYTCQLAWMVYALTTTCRKHGNGYVYVDPPLIPWYAYVIFTIALVANAGWMYVSTKTSYVVIGPVLLVSMTGRLDAMLAIIACKVTLYGLDVINRIGEKDLWTVLILVMNALAL